MSAAGERSGRLDPHGGGRTMSNDAAEQVLAHCHEHITSDR
jgi:hypothetical protein